MELVRKDMEEALMQETNVGKKTVIWKVRTQLWLEGAFRLRM